MGLVFARGSYDGTERDFNGELGQEGEPMGLVFARGAIMVQKGT